MNKTKIFITTMLVAALAAGCSKEDTNGDSTRDNVMRIFAGSFQNDSKVTYNPDVLNQVNWVTGEKISLNCGDVSGDYSVIKDGSDLYYIDLGSVDPFADGGDICGIYPAENVGNNNVVVSNVDGKREIVLNSLAIVGHADESQMAFPMAASANYDGAGEYPSLVFMHLCAGFRVRLNSVPDGLAKLRIVALSGESSAENFQFTVPINGVEVTARWGKQGNGPVLPVGPVGDNDEDVTVGNYSEMNFTVGEGAIHKHKMDFCIPVTIQSIRTLVIVGFAADGETVLFKKTANFASERPIEVNKMYTLPEIEL